MIELIGILVGVFIFIGLFFGVIWTLGIEMEEYKKEHALYMQERRQALKRKYPKTNATGVKVNGGRQNEKP